MSTGRCRKKSWAPINHDQAIFNHQRTEGRFVNSSAVLFLWDSTAPRPRGFVGAIPFAADRSYSSWINPSGLDQTPLQGWKSSHESHDPGNLRVNVSTGVGGRPNVSYINSYLFLISPDIYLVQTKCSCQRHIRTEHYTLAGIRIDLVNTPGSDTKVMF